MEATGIIIIIYYNSHIYVITKPHLQQAGFNDDYLQAFLSV